MLVRLASAGRSLDSLSELLGSENLDSLLSIASFLSSPDDLCPSLEPMHPQYLYPHSHFVKGEPRCLFPQPSHDAS